LTCVFFYLSYFFFILDTWAVYSLIFWAFLCQKLHFFYYIRYIYRKNRTTTYILWVKMKFRLKWNSFFSQPYNVIIHGSWIIRVRRQRKLPVQLSCTLYIVWCWFCVDTIEVFSIHVAIKLIFLEYNSLQEISYGLRKSPGILPYMTFILSLLWRALPDEHWNIESLHMLIHSQLHPIYT